MRSRSGEGLNAAGSVRRGPRGFVCAAALLAVSVAGCAVNPVTGERELALISEQQEIEMGREASEQVAQSIGLVDDEALQEYVERVGLRMAADSERPDLPWQFRVVDDPTPNAFALPGGYIYVTRGLLGLLTSEAELAAVLGHEIGHVTARHSVSQMSRAQLAQLGLGIGAVVSPEVAQLGDLIGTGLQLLFLRYGREDERQSDELGFRYMLEQGYDVTEMADVFRALLAAGEREGASPLPSWLASHPGEAERIENTRERVAELQEPPDDLRVGTETYLTTLDGMVYGENPRNGYFRGDAFYHPELAFTFRVPADWQRRNLPAAVQAVSPEQNAAVELSIVQAGSPREAAETFLGQQGVAPLSRRVGELDGKAAVLSEFGAESQDGSVRGLVGHVAHGGAVYQLVGYAPQQAFSAQARTLRGIVESFSSLTDEDILAVQPRHVEIFELPRRMTFMEFAREHGGSASPEELALINHIDDPGAELPAGTLLKRVTGERPE